MMHIHTDIMNFLKRHTGSEWQRRVATKLIRITCQVLLVIALVLFVALITSDHEVARDLLPYIIAATGLSLGLYTVDRRQMITFGGALLVILYLVFGSLLLQCVAVGPAPIIAFSSAVLTAAVLYGFWCSLIPAALSSAVLLGFQAGELDGIFHPEHIVLRSINTLAGTALVILFLYVLVLIGLLLRRYLKDKTMMGQHSMEVLQTCDLTIDMRSHEVKRGEALIPLRRKEYDILVYLVRHKGQAVPRATMQRELWGESSGSNSIDVHIKHLRDRVDRPFRPALIETTHGVGYTIRDLPIQ